MACHDRRDATIRCLHSLDSALTGAGLREDARVFLVDDGSSDGTAAAAAAAWPGIRIIAAAGDLFWAKAMSLAERVALREAEGATHLLWLNDDVVLDPGSVGELIAVADGDSIVVGALRDSDGATSYSGIRLTSRIHPLRFERVEPSTSAVPVDTLNGNLVLVPVEVALRIGGIDREFRHAFADFDYGVRARRSGVRVMLAPGTLGTGDRNPATAEAPSFAQRRERLIAPTGGALPDVARYLRIHGHFIGVALAVVPVLRFVAGELSRLPLIGRLVPSRALPAPRR